MILLRCFRPLAAVLVAVVLGHGLLGQTLSAETLTFSLLERYFESLRAQAGIPALSIAVVQGRDQVWDSGLGRPNIDDPAPATGATPYPVAELTQALSSTLLLRKCFEESYLELNDRVVRWAPTFGEPGTTIAELLSHTAAGTGYKYDPARFAWVTPVVESCARENFGRAFTTELLDGLAMQSSVPGSSLATPTAGDRQIYSAAELARFADVLRRIATPYRVDARGRATRSDFRPRALDASTGLVSTVRDLARFDAAITHGGWLTTSTLQQAWTRVPAASGTPAPTGLGWYVQRYNGQLLVWQFGMVKDAYSSLILKVPERDVTLILLANSDGLVAPFALDSGDVTASIFAKTFLRLLGI